MYFVILIKINGLSVIVEISHLLFSFPYLLNCTWRRNFYQSRAELSKVMAWLPYPGAIIKTCNNKLDIFRKMIFLIYYFEFRWLCLLLILEGLSAQSASKAFELFKRNQWAVNKKLKLNDEHQKKRVDELTATIEKQNLIIQKLTARLELVESKSKDSSDRGSK